MKRRHIISLLIAALTVLWAACSGNGAPFFIDEEVIDPVPTPEAKYLRASVNSISFSEDAGSQTFTITSNTDWNISCNASWVTISEGSSTHGSGNATITVSVQPNSDNQARTATIVISSNDASSIQISITQSGVTKDDNHSPNEGDNPTPQY